MNSNSRFSFLFLLLILFSCQSPVVGMAGSTPPSHQLWNELLKANVKPDGQVDYKGFIREKPKLEKYLKLLSENAPDRKTWSKNEQLAYWINVYNAFTVKLIVDFTLIVHHRHPFELGGAYWSMNIVLNQLFCFVAIFLYKRYLNEEITANAEFEGYSIEEPFVRCNATDICNSNSTDICYRDDFICEETALESSLWALVAGLFAVSMISFGLFLTLINRNYLWTFFDMRTGKQFVLDNYVCW